MNKFQTLALGVVLAAAGHVAYAAPNLVTNGDFETNNGTGQITSISGWTVDSSVTNAYVVIADKNSDSIPLIYPINFWEAPISLWGPGSGVNNGFNDNGGGYFLAASADSSTPRAAVSQQIGGLTVGAQYVLQFNWAGGQLNNQMVPNTVSWTVTFGTSSQDSDEWDLAPAGFSSWTSESMTFVATSTSQTLSFLGNGMVGAHGMVLLDNVSLTAVAAPTAPVPEPETYAMMLAGLAALGAVARRSKSA